MRPRFIKAVGRKGARTKRRFAVGSDGFVRLLTGDSSPSGDSDEITYVRCLDALCLSSNTQTFLTGSMTLGYSIAIGPDGLARIAYSVFPGPPGHDSSLGFIQCWDEDCGGFTNIIADGGSDNGVSSIAVGSDGTSYIVYDYGNDEDGPQGVGLATCNGATCSTTQIAEISIYDAIGGAIAIGSDGNPVIAYVDDSPGISTAHYYTNGADNVVSYDVGGSDEVDLTIAPDGSARIMFPSSYSSGSVIYIECVDPSCILFRSSSLAGVAWGYGSGAVATDGTTSVQLSLGWWPVVVDDLTCTAADCSAYTVEVVGGSWNGSHSLVMGLDNHPRMLMQDTSGTVYLVLEQVPTSLGGPTATLTVYNGNQLLDCYGQPVSSAPIFYGYQECEAYTVLDQENPAKPIVKAGIEFDEVITVIETNIGITSHTGSAPTDDGGILRDQLNLGSSTGPPAPGSYVVDKQTITLHSTGAVVRVNCLDYEAVDVIVTDITSTPNATCSRN